MHDASSTKTFNNIVVRFISLCNSRVGCCCKVGAQFYYDRTKIEHNCEREVGYYPRRLNCKRVRAGDTSWSHTLSFVCTVIIVPSCGESCLVKYYRREEVNWHNKIAYASYFYRIHSIMKIWLWFKKDIVNVIRLKSSFKSCNINPEISRQRHLLRFLLFSNSIKLTVTWTSQRTILHQ